MPTPKREGEMKPYTDVVANAEVTFDMVPIPGGKFVMGSPDGEPGHKPDEAPQHEVEISPFWMGKCEVTWNEYEVWMFALDIQRRQVFKVEATDLEKQADAVTRPTKPYTDMTFGMGKDGYPAISMTQLAAKTYCKWLSQKTGRYYRLPTEAEWEYACRAGTTTAYSFGDDRGPSSATTPGTSTTATTSYHKVGKKKPNPWGLYDMHGNVAEWTLDQYVDSGYQEFAGKMAVNPLVIPKTVYPEAVRGGAWTNDPEQLRSAARWARTRIGSSKTRSCRKASGTSPTRSSSAFASSGRWSSRRPKRKPKSGTPARTSNVIRKKHRDQVVACGPVRRTAHPSLGILLAPGDHRV